MKGQEGQAAPLPFELVREAKLPVRHQLTELFIQSILSMRIMPGQLLPSTRELAKMLEISRATSVRVYEDLIARGYIETIEGTGTFVRKRLRLGTRHAGEQNAASELPLSSFAQHLMQLNPQRLMVHDFPELNRGCSPPEFLPVNQWRQALLDKCRHQSEQAIDCGSEAFGYRPLRQAICDYLARARMIECPVDRLIVFASSAYPLHAVAELIVDPGDAIAFPEPGATYARDVFNSLGANIVSVPVDEEGLRVDDLMRLPVPPKLIYLNSSHHDPTGAPLSLSRRNMLLAWAQDNSVLIVEDDYDAEMRYAGQPLPSLCALTAKEDVIYISNFWRTLYPLVNVAYMVLPATLAPVLKRAWEVTYHAFHTHLPFFDQEALAELLNGGDYERHLRRVQPTFAARWRTLVHELTVHFGKDLQVARESSSYHLFVQFSSRFHDESIISCAKEAGLPLISARLHYAGLAPHGVFLAPFAHLSEEEIVHKTRMFHQRLSAAAVETI